MKTGRVDLLLLLGLTGSLFSPLAVHAQEPSEEQLERWFDSDEQRYPYEKRSGGEELEFLAPDSGQRIPFSRTRLKLSPRSVQSGWVDIRQCHEGLDAVPDAEVVYRFRLMRGLRVTEALNIGRATVKGQSVQLKDVHREARLCVELEAKILTPLENGRYLLRYGPFQRRFLDSYFPLHVVLEVDYAGTPLKLDTINPLPTQGFTLTKKQNQFTLDGWFRGKLTIEMRFLGDGE